MKVMIVGAGKLGYKLAEAMIHEDIDITLVDSNPTVLQRINDHLDVLTVNANGIEVDALKNLNIETYDLLVDRKSTRLNSSHANISYAVFCLKKKKIQKILYNTI